MSNPGTASGAFESFLIPWAEDDKQMHDRQRKAADQSLLKTAIEQTIRQNPSDLQVRDTLPGTDLSINNGGSSPAYLEKWIIPSALVAGTEVNYVNLSLPNNKAVAFYAVGSPMASPSITRIRFLQNTAAVTGVFQTELMNLMEQPFAYLNTFQLFIPQQQATIAVLPWQAQNANTEQLTFAARTIEPVGTVITNPPGVS